VKIAIQINGACPARRPLLHTRQPQPTEQTALRAHHHHHRNADAQRHAGLNQVAFSGRIRHKALKPGRNLARLTAADDAGAWRAETLRFTIVKH